MKTKRIAALAGLLSLVLTGCATHQTENKTEQKTENPEAWGGTVLGQISRRAVVQKIDYQTREITVKDDTGETTTIVAGPLVRNFNQIRPGDKVALKYRETVTILGVSGVAAVPARAESLDVARAPLGEKPAGVIVQKGEVIADVVAINRKERTVTLKGPRRTLTVQVDKDVKGFDRLKQGDKVYVRSTAALAVAVTSE